METKSRVAQLAIRHPLRIEILRTLSGGVEIEPEAFATAHEMPPASALYHFDVLRDAGALTLAGGSAGITPEGEALYELSLNAERRRVPDRRRGPRRRSDWDD